MKEEYSKLLTAFTQFRKLNISSIIQELSHSDFAAMMSIACCNTKCCQNGERVKVSMLSKELHVNITAVSRTLKGLEEKGYIERSVNKNDRRITYVELTEEGTKVLKRADEIMDDFAGAVLSRLGEDNLVRLTAYMNQLYEVAAQEIDKRNVKGKVIGQNE